MIKYITYSSLALSSETLPILEPFRGLQATNSTSKISVALHEIHSPCISFADNGGK
jgi:hypothetical protein